MPFTAAVCPRCKGNLQLDNDLNKGYCPYCNSIIDISSELNSDVKIIPLSCSNDAERAAVVQILINLVQNVLMSGTNQTPEFKQLLHRTLELDANNEYISSLIHSEIWKAEIKEKVFLRYHGSSSHLTIPYGITKIYEYTYLGNPHIKEVVIPGSITEFVKSDITQIDSKKISVYANTYAEEYAFKNYNSNNINIINICESRKRSWFKAAQLLNEINDYITIQEFLIIKDSQNISVYEASNALSSKLFNHKILIMIISIITMILTIVTESVFFFFGIPLIAGIFIYKSVFVKEHNRQVNKNRVRSKDINYILKHKYNKILIPLGIIDFKFDVYFLRKNNYDLSPYIKDLENAKNKIKNVYRLRNKQHNYR